MSFPLIGSFSIDFLSQLFLYTMIEEYKSERIKLKLKIEM